MLVVGIDPDTNATGFGVIDSDSGRKFVYSAVVEGAYLEDRRIPMAFAMDAILAEIGIPDAVVIEWQKLRPSHLERNPNAIMAVQGIAGAALGLAAGLVPKDRILTPLPIDWRGTIAKEKVQSRIMGKLGLTLDSPEFADIPKEHRSHAIDGLGLALWAIEKRKFERL